MSTTGGVRHVLGLWTACFLFGALLAPGFNSFEEPDPTLARAFAETGRLSFEARPSHGLYTRGQDGRYYTVHEIGSELAAIPAAFMADRIAHSTSIGFARVFGLVMSLAAAGFFATTMVLLGAVGVELGVPRRPMVAALVALTLASQYLVYVGSPPDVSLSAPIFAALILTWMHAERDMRGGWVLSGLLAGCLVAVKLNNVTAAPILLLLAATSSAPASSAVRARAMRVVQTCVGLVPGAVIVATWNYVRTGSWFSAPYPPEASAFALRTVPAGLIGALVSPGKGLFVYTPILLLLPLTFARNSICRTHGRFAVLVFVSLALAMVGLAGTWPAGNGGGGWGIRYYVPWLPILLMILVAEAWHRRARLGPWRVVAGLAIAAGLVANVSGLVTNFHYRQQLCGYEAWSMRGTNVCAVAALPANLARTVGASIPDVIVSGASSIDVVTSNRLALWWYALRFTGVTPLVSWAIGGLLLILAAACWCVSRDAAVSP